VKFVTNIAYREAGALADLIIFEVFVIFEGDELAFVGVEFGNEELQGADGFEPSKGCIGLGGAALDIFGVFDRSFVFAVADVIEGEVANRSEKPCSRVGDVIPVGVELQESILNEVLGGFPLANETIGETEQW